MAEQDLVVLCVIVRTLDEDTREETCSDLWCSFSPYNVVSWASGYRVRLDISKHENLSTRMFGSYEERAAVNNTVDMRLFRHGWQEGRGTWLRRLAEDA